MRIISICCFIILVSCTSTVHKQISRNTLAADIQQIKADQSELDSLKVSFLNYLLSEEGGVLADTLENHRLSYENLFNQLDSIETVTQKYQAKTNTITKRIDSVCFSKHERIEDYKKEKKELNSLVTIKIISIVNTTWDSYKDAVQVFVKVKNHSGARIAGLEFDLKIQNSLKSDSVIFPCKIELPIEQALDHSFVFDEKIHAQIAPVLSQIKFPKCRCTYQITSIVTSGKTYELNTNSIDDLLIDNFNQPIAKNPSKYCIYMKRDDPIITELLLNQDQELKELNMQYPDIGEYYLKIINKYESRTDYY